MKPDDVREMRKKLSMNQSEFWSRLGVTQSGGVDMNPAVISRNQCKH